MIRYYFDSNIFRVIKPAHRFYKKDLHEFLNELKDIVLICFSDAHLDDLKDSLQPYRDEDLVLMGHFVKDNYFSRDYAKKKDQILLATPIDAFYSKDYEAAANFMSNGFNIDELFKELDDIPEITKIKESIKAIFDLPLSMLGDTIDPETIDPKSKLWMDKMMPGYDPSMSLKHFINSVNPFGNAFLKDEKELTELRKYISNYLNRDGFSFEKWGLDFNEKFRDILDGKSFLEMIDGMLLENQKDDLYLKFSYAYSLLEVFNITQERNGKKLKRFTYESLTNDCNHAYFAAYCDYLVTDDKGLQVKAFILYSLFKIPTKVLSSQDLLNHRSLILNREESIDAFAKALKFDLEKSLKLFSKVSLADGTITDTFKTNHFYFNYFNRLQFMAGESTTYVLYCERGSTANFYMFREIELIVNKLIKLLGFDDEYRGEYVMGEKDIQDEGIRKWTIGDLVYELKTSNRAWGTFLCLVFYVDKNKPVN